MIEDQPLRLRYDRSAMTAQTAFHADPGLIIELPERTSDCVVHDCGGMIVRHSLGGGQAVDRCTRCFRRYRVAGRAADEPRGRLRRFIDDFVGWRD